MILQKTNFLTDDNGVIAYAQDVVAGRIIAGGLVRAACARFLSDFARDDIYFDFDAANRVLRFFIERLTLSDGQFDGLPFYLEPSQLFIVSNLHGWRRTSDGLRRFRRAYIEEGKGNGKALALDTPVATAAGWSTMGALRVGDVVFDERGAQCSVTAVSEVMTGRPCYRVVFDDGEAITADASHLWATEARWSGRKGQGLTTKGVSRKDQGRWRFAVRTTSEIAETVYYANGKHQSANHSIPLAGPLQYTDKNLVIHPYVLGAWLGDGDSDCARITAADDDCMTLVHIIFSGVSVGRRKGDAARAGRYRLGIQTALRKMGLLNNKHIPQDYLHGSIEQRLYLLQGLMDTDGTISKAGQCEITLVNEKLINGVLELINSLGIKAVIKESRALLNGKDCGPRYRVSFFPPNDMPVFRLARKSVRQFKRHDRRRLAGDRRIVSCEPVESVPVRCISVGSSSRLFLAGRGMVPTHNSPLAAGLGLYAMMADNEPGAQVYAAATTLDQADVLFQDAVRMAKNNPALWSRLIPAGKDRVKGLTVGSGKARGSFFKPVTHMIGKRGGSGPRPSCVLIDELHEHPDRTVVDILERGFKFRRQPMIVMLTNSGFDLRSVCWEEREHAVRALSGDASGDDTFAYICSLDKGDDPFRDRSCWPKANPLLGVILSEEYLSGVVAQAKSIPGRRNNILRLHFCRWTDAETAWLDRETWTACEDETLNIEDYAGCRARIGLDLSSRKDMAALTVVVDTGDLNDAGKPIFAVFAKTYTPAATLRAREDADRAPYELWVQQGYLTATPGEIIKFKFIIADLADLQQLLNVEAVAYDRYLIARFEEELEEEGVDLPLIEHPQGWSRRKSSKLWMPGSIQLLEEWIADRRLRIDVNPVIRSAVAGAKFLTSPTELRRFDKAHATQRIDALIALTQAIGAWGLTEEPADDSAWNSGAPQSDEQRARRGLQHVDHDDDDDSEWR